MMGKQLKGTTLPASEKIERAGDLIGRRLFNFSDDAEGFRELRATFLSPRLFLDRDWP
jgi:hypothetical protein